MPTDRRRQVWKLKTTTDARGVVHTFWEHAVRKTVGRNKKVVPSTQFLRCNPEHLANIIQNMLIREPDQRQEIVFLPWEGEIPKKKNY
jgi:hypothetical protein